MPGHKEPGARDRRYRPDIDGLRAVAVILVLLFHAGTGGFDGGYIGVDIFFVISGFLITGIVGQEIAADRFSLAAFYARRIRRIFPALFVMLALVTIVALVILLPDDLTLHFERLLSVSFFSSNILFWRQGGYFAVQGNANLLLNTWSLAVEEQFYIFFPLVLLAMRRRTPLFIWIVLGSVAVLSLLLDILSAGAYPEFAFYMTVTRGWELLAGAFLAQAASPATGLHPAREWFAIAGVALIVLALVMVNSTASLPVIASVLTVAGTVLLIRYAPETRAGRILAIKPMIFLGLISYSLYLWHWPVLACVRYMSPGEGLSAGQQCYAVLFCVLIAAASWALIEQPFRNRRVGSTRTTLRIAAVTMAVATAVGLAGLSAAGWSSRFPDAVIRLDLARTDFSPRRHQCLNQDGQDIAPEQSCIEGVSEPPTVAIWGDSHAVEIAYALRGTLNAHHLAMRQLSSSACPPALDFNRADRQHCRQHNARVLAYLQAHAEIGTVLMVGHYSGYGNDQAIVSGLRAAVAALVAANKQVVLLLPIPSAPWQVPETLANYARFRPEALPSIPWRLYLDDNQTFIDAINAMKSSRVQVVSPADLFCHRARCEVYRQDQVLYFDDNHLSVQGALQLVPLLEPFLPGSDASGHSVNDRLTSGHEGQPGTTAPDRSIHSGDRIR